MIKRKQGKAILPYNYGRLEIWFYMKVTFETTYVTKQLLSFSVFIHAFTFMISSTTQNFVQKF